MSNDSRSFLAQETLGSSANLSNLASVEATDGSSTKCLSEIAEYRTAAQTNTLAIGQLQSADDDDGDGTNSEIEQLNLVNAAQAAALHEQQSQGALHACLVEQQILIQYMAAQCGHRNHKLLRNGGGLPADECNGIREHSDTRITATFPSKRIRGSMLRKLLLFYVARVRALTAVTFAAAPPATGTDWLHR